jgi:hypothetical protein
MVSADNAGMPLSMAVSDQRIAGSLALTGFVAAGG